MRLSPRHGLGALRRRCRRRRAPAAAQTSGGTTRRRRAHPGRTRARRRPAPPPGGDHAAATRRPARRPARPVLASFKRERPPLLRPRPPGAGRLPDRRPPPDRARQAPGPARRQARPHDRPGRPDDASAPTSDRAHRAARAGACPRAALQLRLSARDTRGRRLRAARGASTSTRRSASTGTASRSPGAFSYSGDGGRFGAGRPGHVHQGQDLTAPGHAGRRTARRRRRHRRLPGGRRRQLHRPAGAGENRSYVFMHLLDGSTRVREGQRVRTGQRLGRRRVDRARRAARTSTSRSGWAPGSTAARPIDPLPDLRRWDAWS